MVSTMTPVNDPNLVAQLEGNQPIPNMGQAVIDPNLISQLESSPSTSQNPQDVLHQAQNYAQSHISGLLPGGKNEMSPAMQNVLLGLVSGGTSLLGGSLASGALGALQAPPGQKLESGAENALLGLGLGSAFNTTGKLLKPFITNSISKSIQNYHDSLSNMASQGFQDVSNGVAQRGIQTVPIENDILDQIKDNKYFPNTPKFNSLINDARGGDYNSLRDLQSELWNKGTKGVKSQSIADQNQGEEMLDTRDKINDAISNHLVSTGNDDLNNTLNQSRYGYQKLRDIFYNKNLNPTIRDLVDPDVRLMPEKNALINALKENSKPMNELKNFLSNGFSTNNYINPVDIASNINAINARQNFGKMMKALTYGGGGLLGAGTLYHYFMPEQYKIGNIFEQNQ